MPKVVMPYVMVGDAVQMLKNAGFEVVLPDDGALMTRAELLGKIADVDGLYATRCTVDAELIGAAKNLKMISSVGAGYDNIDVRTASERGIIITNTPVSTAEATADVAFALILSVMRETARYDRLLRHDVKAAFALAGRLCGKPLLGATLGIVGMGRIGRALARRAVACGMKVVYHNRRKTDDAFMYCETLAELLRVSDVVSLNCPLTPETRHMIGEKELALMKKDAFIVNTSRGAVIEEAALIRALKQGVIAGAGLDVYENEPDVSVELIEMENVTLFPHIGTATLMSRSMMAEEGAQHLIDFFTTGKVECVVNP